MLNIHADTLMDVHKGHYVRPVEAKRQGLFGSN
jgi:hypothetical protein